MAKNTSVQLGKHFENFITKGISSGRYSSASEVIKAGLRLVEEREKKRKLLRKALQKGLRSGLVKNFDPVAYLKSIKEEYAKSRKKKTE